jgi:predicted metalloprotease
MQWRKGRASDNVFEDGGGGGRGIGPRHVGLGGLVVLAILGAVFFKDPTALLGLTGGDSQQTSTQRSASGDPQTEFVRRILGSTEDVWGAQFQALGKRYEQPRMVLFRGSVRTACGAADSAVGPFYCPGDHQVYLDLGFFEEMESQFHESGDFARAYVIAHEVGHHVQNLLGIFAKADEARRRGARLQGPSGLSVRQELQADCFAGVWANRAQAQLQWLQPGDIESALHAANAIGDDTLQREARGKVMPDSFTHGTSEQRVRWFKTGFASGELNRCDTFKGGL